MASIRSGWRPCRGGFGEIPHGIDATPGQSDQSLDCCLWIVDLFGHRDGRAEVRLGGLVGVYRLWRDGGFAIGAVLTGVFATPTAFLPRSGPWPLSPSRPAWLWRCGCTKPTGPPGVARQAGLP